MGDRPTILSTRHLRPSALALAEKQGIGCVCADFIETQLLKNAELEKASVSPADPYIFTSAHAVEGALQYAALLSRGTLPKKVFCLEGATLQAAGRQPGWQVAATAADAATLAEKILLEKESMAAVSFFCGQQRLDTLPELLGNAGLDIKEYVVYETRATGRRIEEPYQAVLFFSPSAVDAFFRLNQPPAGLPCFCIGATTAAALVRHGNYPVILASHPSQESVMEAAVNYFMSLTQSAR